MSTISNRDFRPKLHFSAKKMWINDPNGLVYAKGLYHMFYQYYPGSTEWGPMHWGHAVSSDLYDWEEKEIALYPDSLGQIYSGCAVYDEDDSSGFGVFGVSPMVLIYTQHQEYDCERREIISLAYSLDGEHFHKYEGNPVLEYEFSVDFRDPKVLRAPDGKGWNMVVAAKDRVIFFRSDNLRKWEKSGEFGPLDSHVGLWECPDLFPIFDQHGTKKWVLIVSYEKKTQDGGPDVQYFVGDFDGKNFSSDLSKYPKKFDAGCDNYAGITFENAPERVYIAWQSNWRYAAVLPTGDYSGIMSLPKKLFLRDTPDAGHIISCVPYDIGHKIEELRYLSHTVWCTDPDWNVEKMAPPKTIPIADQTFGLKISGSGEFKMSLENAIGQKLVFGLDGEGNFYTDRRLAGQNHFSEVFSSEAFSVRKVKRASAELDYVVEILFDVSVMDLFADDGDVNISLLVYPDMPYNKAIYDGNVEITYIAF